MIHALGAMEATSELQTLYPTFSDRESRVAVLEAFSMAGDSEPLEQLLATETDPELRKTAIIQSMMIMENVEGLISLIKQENDPELKRQLLEVLTVMDTEAADECLFELLEKQG